MMAVLSFYCLHFLPSGPPFALPFLQRKAMVAEHFACKMQASQKVLQFAMQTADTGRDLQNVSKPKTQFFRKKCVSNYGGSVGDPNILMLDLSMALRAIVRRTVRVSILLCKMDPWRYAQSPKGRMHSLGDCAMQKCVFAKPWRYAQSPRGRMRATHACYARL